MKAKTLVLIYFIIASIELYAELKNFTLLRYLFKPMLMPLLMGFAVLQCQELKLQIPIPLIYALFFSFLGDVFLLYVDRREIFFLLGLGAFLIGHIFYILLNMKNTPKQALSPRKIIQLLPMLLLAFFLLYKLRLNVGSMLIPIMLYTFVLIALYYTGLLTKSSTTTTTWRIIFIGILLFILSDSMIAWSKFISPFAFSSFFIMLLYIISQYLLTIGFVLKQFYHYGRKNN